MGGKCRVQRSAAAHQTGTCILVAVSREQADGRTLCQGQAAVIFQQDNALAVDAVGQVGFRSADIVCRVIRRVVVKVQAIRLHLAVIPRLLVAQHGIDHAGIPGQDYVGRKQQNRHDNCQNAQNSGVQYMAHDLQRGQFFLLHLLFPPCILRHCAISVHSLHSLL